MLVKSYEEENIGQALIDVERKDEAFLSTTNMVDHIPYGSTSKIPYSSSDWVDRNTFGMKTVGGEEFNFCNKFFVVTSIVLTCGKPQKCILQSSYTSSTYAHEVHCDLYVLEGFGRKQNGYQELALIQKDEEDFGQAFVDLKQCHEEELTMGKIDEEIIFEETCNAIFYPRIV